MNDPRYHPPAWADWLLGLLCRPDYLDEIQGDLHEAFYWRLGEKGPSHARASFVLEVVKSLRPQNLKSFYHFSLNTMVFRNYLKTAFRSLMKGKSSSFINVFGLSVGVAAFILIFIYAYGILAWDNFHQKKDRIFLAYKERITPNGTQPTYDTWVPMKDRLKADYAQVKEACRHYEAEARVIRRSQYVSEEIAYSDEAFFRIFSFPILHGNEDNVFPNKNSIALSRELAMKYFQIEDPIGEPLDVFLANEDTVMRYYISAVFEDAPAQSSLKPDLVILIESIPEYSEIANNWSGSFLETYVLLDKPTSASYLESVFPELIENLWGKETRDNTNFKLLPLDAYYDTFIGDKGDALTLLFIGIGILLVAVINFMNLSTAQASQRGKEIGLRKVLGAYRGQLGVQFITEAVVVSFLAVLIGFILVVICVPYFNEFFDVTISVAQFSVSEIVAGASLLIAALGVLSGSYPAFYLSSIRVLDVLRRRMGFGGSVGFRNALVITQFSITAFLISAAFIVRDQISHMSAKPMGFDGENILVIKATSRDFVDRDEGTIRLSTFKEQLRGQSFVQSVTMSRAVPTFWTRSFTFVRPDGWTGDPLRMRYTFVDAGFFETYGMTLKSGDSFLPDSEGDQRRSVILNEAAMKAFQFDPEDRNVIKIGDDRINVVGVIEDFNFESVRNEVAPTLIFHRTADHPVHTFITCRITPENLVASLDKIEALWNDLGATKEFTYSFMDDRLTNLYQSEKRYMRLITLFSAISIFVACLGLYGLTLFVIEKRRKEISIRKVLGAEVRWILGLICRDFTRWVAVAFCLSVPLVVYFMKDWLEQYHYRVDVSWLPFVLTVLIILGLVLITVGYQSLKAAIASPVKYLRDE